MSEERFPGDLLESRPSSAKVALSVAGIIAGLGLLVCAGVAGYVALTTAAPEAGGGAVSTADDPENIRLRASNIIQIDVPAGFEPLSSDGNMPMSIAQFGRKDVTGATLALARVDLSVIPPTDADQARSRMVGLLEMRIRRGAEMEQIGLHSPPSNREFTVLGQKATFQFVDGTFSDSGLSIRKISGAFRTHRAHIALVYTVPAGDYDEDAFLKMLESIRPPAGDSMPDEDAAEDSGEGASQKPGARSAAAGSGDAEEPDGPADPDRD